MAYVKKGAENLAEAEIGCVCSVKGDVFEIKIGIKRAAISRVDPSQAKIKGAKGASRCIKKIKITAQNVEFGSQKGALNS